MPRTRQGVTMWHLLDQVKAEPEDDDGESAGGCGDGDGCGRQ
ncbi:hypothetical protein OG946_23195 [Streptomyces sp. NBC_01808]|nr:hypothetical protein [Streptomyces sp. NBC_01808]WSA40017.1 hypothetical protein OG946_23195 [Streptomyces sp. NBC_01808]